MNAKVLAIVDRIVDEMIDEVIYGKGGIKPAGILSSMGPERIIAISRRAKFNLGISGVEACMSIPDEPRVLP